MNPKIVGIKKKGNSYFFIYTSLGAGIYEKNAEEKEVEAIREFITGETELHKYWKNLYESLPIGSNDFLLFDCRFLNPTYEEKGSYYIRTLEGLVVSVI